MIGQQSKPVIGLVGGIGSGKSLVAGQLAGLGAVVIDADQLAKQALDEPEVREQLVDMWGASVVGADGMVDRSYVGGLVFGDPGKLRELEALIHPRVKIVRRIRHERCLDDPEVVAVVEDCPLLLETGLDADCDAVIFVHADRATRLERVRRGRGWTDEELARRENLQIGLDNKQKRADYSIVNNAGQEDCLQQVQSVFSQILDRRA